MVFQNSAEDITAGLLFVFETGWREQRKGWLREPELSSALTNR